MPATTFIAPEAVVNNRKGRPESAAAKEMRDYCVATIAQALADGKVAEVTLSEDERYSAIVLMFKKEASEVNAAVKFVNLARRNYASGDKTLTENYKFQVIVVALPVAVTPVAE